MIYALFGYVWFKGLLQPGEHMSVGPNTVLIMIAWLFFCMTGWLGPIGNAAHVTGLVVGILWVLAGKALSRTGHRFQFKDPRA